MGLEEIVLSNRFGKPVLSEGNLSNIFFLNEEKLSSKFGKEGDLKLGIKAEASKNKVSSSSSSSSN